MNRNQKIALGCGGAGCLGLIVAVIAGGLIYFFAMRRSYSDHVYNSNITTNRNSNDNDNEDTNSNSNASSSSSASAASMSEDDKHKLYHAAGMTSDPELIRRVSVKVGLFDEDYTPGADYERFLSAHGAWVFRNTDFIQSVDTADKARAYVNEHLPD